MLLLRLACLLAGLLVLLAPPAMLFPRGTTSGELAATSGMLATLLLAAASFFFIAAAGHRLRRSPDLRRLCLLLLGAPFLAAITALLRAADPAAIWLSSLLLAFTLIVSAALASPLLQSPSPRRQRARDIRHAQARDLVLYDPN